MHKAAIGGFDGVHYAHQQILKRATLAVIIEKGSSLTPGFDRVEFIKIPFEFLFLEKIKNKTPIEFIEYLKRLKITEIVVGEDFKFGKNKSGDIELLKKFFSVEVIKEIEIENIKVHSSIIREYLKKDLNIANKLLNRFYQIKGVQIKGQGLGSKELLPTINIEPIKPYIIPKEGVYLTKTNSINSITFIGKRFSDKNFSIETHLLDFKPIEKLIKIEFISFLRENIKPKNIKELKNKIQNDLLIAKNFFSSFRS